MPEFNYNEWIPLGSDNIEAVLYNGLAQQLQVRFKSGAEYHYFQVPDSIFSDLMRAPSKGEYFSEHISKRGSSLYRYERVK